MLKKYFKIIFINLLVIVVSIELVSMIYIKVTKPVIPDYQRIPTYLDIMTDGSISFNDILFGSGEKIQQDPLAPRNIDTSYTWCNWHPRNNVHREKFPCFDVLYKYNELGTRGTLPDPNDTSTILFIGDSFVEGFGLEEDSTLPARIHQKIGRPVLNLGTSGHFSPTQMSLIYSAFAEKFRHKEVYVMFYLENDLIENNIDNHYKLFANRYRPYRVLTNDDSSNIVYKGSLDSTTYSWAHYKNETQKVFAYFPPNTSLLTKISRLTYFKRCLNLLKMNAGKKSNPNEKPTELNYTSKDLQILEKDMLSIIQVANTHHAKVTFVNLPSKNLFNYAGQSASNLSDYKTLETKLAAIAEKGEARYISFYDYINSEKIKTEQLFFPCDFHYSNYGEAILSEFTIFKIKQNK
jgi:hypothetical protein